MRKNPLIGLLVFILFLFILGLASLSIYIAIRERSDTNRRDSLFERADEISDEYHQIEQQPSVSHKEDSQEEALEDLSESADSGHYAGHAEEELLSEADMGNIPEIDSGEEYTAQNHRIIFVGDSRTVGMDHAMRGTDDHCLFIGMSGEGYYWFADEGIRELAAAIKEDPKAPVVFNLGVNDTEAIYDYLELYRELPRRFPRTTFYFMSVNPVTRESAHVTNQDIRAFNRRIKAAFSDQYIDSYRWMKLAGFECVDGVHYSEKTYCAIHDFAVKAIYAPESSRWFFTGEIPWETESITEEMSE